jgi:cell wall-associated NlpC family hydrolase
LPELSRFARRLVPARPDLAAAHLAGRIAAARHVVGETMMVSAPLLDLTGVPDGKAERMTQLLFGERFTVYAREDGFAWGQAEDLYVGYVPAEGLAPPPATGSAHRVRALLTHLHPEPSVRSRPLCRLPFMARIAVTATDGAWAEVAGGGFVPRAHVVGEGSPPAGDFVAEAERFLGLPYLWGGRSAEGLDCSALVQLALIAAGIAAPRDSDMQAAFLGAALGPEAAPCRGDLVFWRGHVGIMLDAARLIHANAHAMAVTIEPLDAVIGRVAAAGEGGVTGRRRLSPGTGSWIPRDLPCPP